MEKKKWTSGDEPGNVYAYGSSALQKVQDGAIYHLSYLVGYCNKAYTVSGILLLFDLQKQNERGSFQESDQWPGMTSQIALFPDPFQ